MIVRARMVLPVATPPIEDGALWIEGETIRAVGRFDEIRTKGGGELVDLGNAVLLPGLVNAHCHLELTDLAAQVPFEGGFTDWLRRIVSVKGSWTHTDYEHSATRGTEMLLASGTTTACDVVSWWPLAPKLHAGRLRIWSCLEMIDFAGQRPWREWIESAESWVNRVPNPRGGWGLSPHAPYTATGELYGAAKELMVRAKLIQTTHICESLDEREMFEEAGGPLYEWLVRLGRDMYDCGGRSSLEMLHKYGVLNEGMVGVHLNGLDDREIDLIAQTGMTVVHCPTSHRYFGHPAFPLEQLLARGVNVCVGTDSLASAPAGSTLDMFAEMRLLRRAFPGLSGDTILKLATVNGAMALQAADRLGTLEPGKWADLISLKLPAEADLRETSDRVVSGNLSLGLVMIHGELITR